MVNGEWLLLEMFFFFFFQGDENILDLVVMVA